MTQKPAMIDEDVSHVMDTSSNLTTQKDTDVKAVSYLKGTKEKWRDIYKYEGLYQVSNKGNVKNLLTKKLITLGTNARGYKYVSLYKNYEGKKTTKLEFVHRLVALAFVPIYSFDRNRVNHLDGDKANNELYNLEWVTNKENSQHFLKSLKQDYKFGDDNHNTKLKIYEIQKIRKLYDETKFTQKELSEMYNVSQSAISQIVNAKIRKKERLIQKKKITEQENEN